MREKKKSDPQKREKILQSWEKWSRTTKTW
jgi:hypothetical protein